MRRSVAAKRVTAGAGHRGAWRRAWDVLRPTTPGYPRQVLLGCCLGLGLMVAGATTLLVLHLRDRALHDANRELLTLSMVLAAQAERSFEAVELLQDGILERLRDAGLRTPDDFRRLLAGRAMHDDLRGRARSLPQLDAITAIDADGALVNFSRYWPIPPVNVADRDYFQALRGDAGAARFVGAPVRNRGTGSWTIYLARRVSGPGGEFLGLILGAVELAYFEDLYAGVAAGPSSSIALFRQDGVLLARHPHLDPSIGQSFADAPIFRQLRSSGARSGLARQTSQADGQDRLIASQLLTRFPLVVNATTTLDAALSAWRQQAAYLVSSALLLVALVIGFGLLAHRQLRGQQQLADARAAHAGAEAAQRNAEAHLALAQERERAERELRQQHGRFAAAIGNMSQALCMFNAADRLVVANDRLAEMFRLPRSTIRPGVDFDAIMALAEAASALGTTDSQALCHTFAQLIEERRARSFVQELADGRALAVNFRPMDDGGWLVTWEDVTERRQAEAKIAHMAHHDALTGLPNRVLFHSRLRQAIARSRRGEPCAVICLDLDHFKAVNDTLGHPIGDALLRAVTTRLRQYVREVDTVARLGGDEFAIVQTGVDLPQDARALARRLIEALSAPYELDGHQVVIGTSIGIAVAPHDSDDPHQLLKNADMALYRAKADGRGRYRFFEPEMDAMMQARRALELDLRKALLAGEFEVFYQPLLHLRTRRVSGFEALLRWRHPSRGLVSPAEFIPLAEEIGLIVPLGEWVLRRACADAMTWPGSLKVAVNLSPAQFVSRTLVQDVSAALASSGLPPARLELEITETVMLADTEATLAVLHRLRKLGVAIAMDDFGTGYSSLSYLRRFPFDKVKIDRSFIEGLGQGGDCDAIVGAVTELCARLGMTTTAEGVETAAQLAMLSAGACTEVQGYLFSRPCPADEVAALCRTLGAAELEAPDSGIPAPALASV